jgi:hypothetical protein
MLVEAGIAVRQYSTFHVRAGRMGRVGSGNYAAGVP